MPSLIKVHLSKRDRPVYGSIDVRRKLIWYPRVLPAPSLRGKMQLRWLGVERITYQYSRWKAASLEGPPIDVCGWRAIGWYW